MRCVRRALLFAGLGVLVGCGGASAGAPTTPLPEVPRPAQAPRHDRAVHVREWGDEARPSLVLIHGLGSAASSDFDPIVPALSEHFHVIAPDLPGFGASEPGDHPLTPHAFAGVVETVIREHARPPVYVLGHSLGGAVAIALAGARPELVDRLVLVDVAGVLHREAFVASQVTDPMREAGAIGSIGAGITSSALSIVRSIEPDPRTLLETPFGARALLGGDVGATAALALIATDLGPDLDGIDAPTLILWGERDRIAPLRTSILLASRIRDARRVVLPGVGHVPMSERPDEVVRRVHAFLSSPVERPRPERFRSSRRVACSGERGVTLTGDLASVTLDRCTGVRIHDARIGRLVIRSSDAVLDSVTVLGRDGPALVVEDADVVMTGGAVIGRPALDADASRLDLAGVTIRGPHAPLVVREPTRALFSACVVDDGSRRHLHGETVLSVE